jgi:UDP-N-acetyl-D-mannosaminuronic acid dehydrogenase
MDQFSRDIAVVGAGHIGLPWAAVLAADGEQSVTCVDVDERRVTAIENGESPFEEPGLGACIRQGIESGRLRATLDPSAVTDHEYVAFTVNASRNEMDRFLDTLRGYTSYLSPDQLVISRTTLPVHMISRVTEVLAADLDEAPELVVFPERLAEGKAVEEIRTLPKVIGVSSEGAKTRMRALLNPLGGDLNFTTPQTAMFVKLIDNTYRDALFAIANQIAYVADVFGLDSREAIELANSDYSRNDIPSPGPVGGKCLPKDPHFLMDETICDQPTTPDLFTATRRTNARLPSYVATEILKRQPSKVAILGLSYKAGVGDTYRSPADDIRQILSQHGVYVDGYDPYLGEQSDLQETLTDADVVVLAVNHDEFDGVESEIERVTDPDTVVYDLWGHLDEASLSRVYGGFGISNDQ